MAEKSLLFTWKPESFDEALRQPNLIDLRIALAGKRPISESLLISKKVNENESWWLVDFGHQKIYHLDKNSDTEIAVSEEVGNWRGYPPLPLNQEAYGTPQGFGNWLMGFKADLDEYNPETLKRTDLSEKKRSFEIVHSHLLTVYEMFHEILESPNEWSVGLPNSNVQHEIQSNLEQFLKILDTIRYFDSHNSSERYKEVLQQTFNLCNKVHQQLHQLVVYLRSKKAEQFETQMNTIVADAKARLNAATDELQKHREEAEQNEATRQKEFTELQNKLANESAKKLTAEQQITFAEQAKRHQRAAWAWLGVTGSLIVGLVVGIISFGLLDILKLEGSEWTVVLQNIFKKGSVLTLFYFALNRSIKNYTAQKHLEVVNRHRQRALDTFPELVESLGNNPETRHAVLSAATNAIFDANQSGYLSTKTKGTESVNPIQQVFGAMRGSSTGSEN